MKTATVAALILFAGAVLLFADDEPPLTELLVKGDLVVVGKVGKNETIGAGNMPGLILKNTVEIDKCLKGKAAGKLSFSYVGYHPKLKIHHLEEGKKYILVLKKQPARAKVDYSLADGNYGALAATDAMIKKVKETLKSLPEKPKPKPVKPKDDKSATSKARRVAHFAVVSCGSTHGSPQHKKWYWGSNQRICKMLTENYGYPDEAIFRLHEEGKAKDPAVDGKSSLANFRKVFAHLAKIMKKDDHLFIYIVGHGGPLRRGQWDGDYVHDLIDARLTGTEFDKLLDALPSQNISIAMNPCHSGGFIPKISGKGRVVCTSTRGTQSNAAGWEGYFTNALAGKGQVDADGDGRVSMKEAYNASVDGTLKWYKNKKRPLGENPLLDDNGDGKGHYGKDKVVDGDGELAAKRFLGDEGRKLEYKASALRALKKLNRKLSLK